MSYPQNHQPFFSFLPICGSHQPCHYVRIMSLTIPSTFCAHSIFYIERLNIISPTAVCNAPCPPQSACCTRKFTRRVGLWSLLLPICTVTLHKESEHRSLQVHHVYNVGHKSLRCNRGKTRKLKFCSWRSPLLLSKRTCLKSWFGAAKPDVFPRFLQKVYFSFRNLFSLKYHPW